MHKKMIICLLLNKNVYLPSKEKFIFFIRLAYNSKIISTFAADKPN